MSEYLCLVNPSSFICDVGPEDGTVHLCCPDACLYLSAEDAVKLAKDLLSAALEVGRLDV
jgi:hypothetical protein